MGKYCGFLVYTVDTMEQLRATPVGMKIFKLFALSWISLSKCQAAVSMVDVSTPFGGTKESFNSFGQTFTPGESGSFDRLRILIASSAPSFTVSVWQVDPATGNLGNLLGSQAITSSRKFSSYGWAEVTFATPIQQIAGRPMAFTILGGPNFWGPAISDTSTYSGGGFFEYSGNESILLLNRDLNFQTFFTPIPEPGVPLAVTMALVASIFWRWRTA